MSIGRWAKWMASQAEAELERRPRDVLELVPRPEPFNSLIGKYGVRGNFVPKRPSRSRVFIGQVEWAWCPGFDRRDEYYLHRARRHWILWCRSFNELTGRWQWIAIACVERNKINQYEAAIYLLFDFWNAEYAEGNIEQMPCIGGVGFLSGDEVYLIAKNVWLIPLDENDDEHSEDEVNS